MPLFGMQTSTVSNANRALAASFFPRFRRQTWTRLGAALPPVHRYVEPFAFPGAAPMMSRWNGSVLKSVLNSYKLQVPMHLFKNFGNIGRSDLEFDQTGAVPKTFQQYGAALAETPDFALASQILRGHLTSSCQVVSDVDGITYNTTFEPGVPVFSASHTFNGKGATQSNIVTGNLPTTASALAAQEIATTVQQIQMDMNSVVDRIASWVDDKGRVLFPNLDTAEDLVVAGPPILRQAFQLAFKTGNAVVGGVGGQNGGSGSTTNVVNTFVKDAFTWSLLRGCPDVYNDLAALTPSYGTAYYIGIKNDYVQPAYWMPYAPPKGADFLPRDYDPLTEAERIVKEASESGVEISPLAAVAYASAIIDHNLNAIGDKAQASVVESEQFFMSGRQRGNWVMGPWFTWIKVVPSGQST